MAVRIYASELFPEKGARGVQIAFTDDAGNPVVPNSITWTLTDVPELGSTPTVINSRLNVSATPASTIVIALEGDDLAVQTGEENLSTVLRLITVNYQYDSVNMGINQDDKVEFQFGIRNAYYTT